MHDSTASAGPDAIPNVTHVELSDVTRLPYWSCTDTAGCVANATPPRAPTGWVVNPNFDAVPTTNEICGDPDVRFVNVPGVDVFVLNCADCVKNVAVGDPAAVNVGEVTPE